MMIQNSALWSFIFEKESPYFFTSKSTYFCPLFSVVYYNWKSLSLGSILCSLHIIRFRQRCLWTPWTHVTGRMLMRQVEVIQSFLSQSHLKPPGIDKCRKISHCRIRCKMTSTWLLSNSPALTVYTAVAIGFWDLTRSPIKLCLLDHRVFLFNPPTNSRFGL